MNALDAKLEVSPKYDVLGGQHWMTPRGPITFTIKIGGCSKTFARVVARKIARLWNDDLRARRPQTLARRRRTAARV